MIVVVTLANGGKQIFRTENYVISTKKDLHPMILKCVVLTESGKKIAKISRFFKWFYKHFIFPSEKIQTQLRKEKEMMEQEMPAENTASKP